VVDPGVLASKLASIRDATQRIREVLPAGAASLATDRDARAIVALNLLVAVQDAIDLAAHAIADAGRAVPGNYKALFDDLVARDVIEPSLGDRLAAACGLRNLIAHPYGRLDWTRVHEAASNGITDLEAFCAALSRPSAH